MRKFLQQLFSPLVIRLANKYSSRPDAERVQKALTALHNNIIRFPGKRGELIRL